MFNFFKKKVNKEIEIDENKLYEKYGDCRILSNKIKLLIIADTHGLLEYKEEEKKKLKSINDYDLCCCLGDISYDDYEIILKYVPKEKIVALLGNHDDFEVLNHYGLNDINGKTFEINGIRFGGIQGSYRYKDEKFPSFTHEESINFLDKMDEVDILLSHSGPYIDDSMGPVHSGLKGITYYLYKNHVPYIIHGHNHENVESYLKNGTKVIQKYMIEELIIN